MMLQNGQSSLRDCIDTPKVGVNNPQKESQIFADSMLFFAKNHFPTQKWAKMLWRTLSEVISLPVISAR